MADRIDGQIPEQLKSLAVQLAALSVEDRELVISATRAKVRRPLRSIPWEELRKLEGILSLGGDAVEDCKALYDDA